jgi:uncharacterized membrane protein
MSRLTSVLRELAGLFVDDGWLALAILGIVALARAVATLAPAEPLAAGVVLLVGCVGVLFGNAVRAARGSIRNGSK